MQAHGGVSDFDISDLAILGFTEALKAYPVVRRKVKEAAELILSINPDAVVLIDSWGFMIRVAEALKKADYKGTIIKYVAPQVWAMRPGRAKTLARFTDHLLSIHRFDAPYFEKEGLPVTFVGNPMFDEDFSPGHKGDFKKRYKIKDWPVVTVLFGSRSAEINSLYEPFAATIDFLQSRFPNVHWFTVSASNTHQELDNKRVVDERTAQVIDIPEGEKKELFANTDIALACSGTVTTQLAMSGVPAVVAYKLSPATFFIAKRLYQPNHISLVNISADKPLMKEFVQKVVTVENLSGALAGLLTNDELRRSTSSALIKQTEIMRGEGGPASDRAASAIFEILA